jgi:hypothetical protein
MRNSRMREQFTTCAGPAGAGVIFCRCREGSLRQWQNRPPRSRGHAVFLTARQTGLWLLDADSRIRDSVYERPRLNHSIFRGRNHSIYHVERTVATLNCHQWPDGYDYRTTVR